MTTLKRTLAPIRLAIPTLLVLTVSAAWTPTETWVGTGFVAEADPSTSAGLIAGYANPGVPKNIHFLTKWRDSSSGSWTTSNDFWISTDNLIADWTGITKPPVDWAIAQANDSSNGLAYASVSDF